ncbi:hypothetical protein SAMN06295888_12240 [Desulfonatronum zhilinae]|nr:hypothetical protein SAMN06295888_12240 [Desulfonatronum zhilinae]
MIQEQSPNHNDSPNTSREEAPPQEWEFDEEFDGGEETCGRVIINLYTYLLPMPPGTKVLLISKDPAAPIEFPAWCRMTRNTLLDMRHPHYLIEYKPERKKE